MKKIKLRAINYYNVILSALMALLGFTTSCDPQDEYGTPSAKFIVRGKVSSVANGLPVQNIRVKILNDSSFTTSGGEYEVESNSFPGDQIINIRFEDVDGSANGQYSTLDTSVQFIDPQFTGGDGNWYSGQAEKTFDVELTPKK